MIKYTPLNSALRFIPKPLYDQSSDLDFLSWMLDGFRYLDLPVTLESKIKFFELDHGKIKLPEDIKEIKLITYLYQDPTKEECSSFNSCISNPESNATTEDTNNPCQYTIAYKQFLDSPYYNNNFTPLHYKGNYSSLLCSNCPNKFSVCQNYFTIDKNNILYTNITDGYLCIDYLSEMKDCNDDFLIPDVTELKQYLAYYAIVKHWEERAAGKEQSAFQMAQDSLVKAETYLKKNRGIFIMRSIDANAIVEVQGGKYNRLIQLPEHYVYSR